MEFLISVAAPVFVIVSIVLFIEDGILAKKEERNRHKIFTNMFAISIGIICLYIGFWLSGVMVTSFFSDSPSIVIGIVLALLAIIFIILFIRDGILAKKEERRRDKIVTVVFIISMSIIVSSIFWVSVVLAARGLGSLLNDIFTSGMGGM